MPKSENQKLKTLYVAKFFLENSDENHAITASDILDYLREECSIEAERRSIYRDIAILRDEFGMDIDGGQTTSPPLSIHCLAKVWRYLWIPVVSTPLALL